MSHLPSQEQLISVTPIESRKVDTKHQRYQESLRYELASHSFVAYKDVASYSMQHHLGLRKYMQQAKGIITKSVLTNLERHHDKSACAQDVENQRSTQTSTVDKSAF